MKGVIFLQLTVCICEVREFVVGHAGNQSCLKNQSTNYVQKFAEVGQARTNDSER